jgi:hypothetical protein
MKRERGVVEMADSDTSPPFRRRAFFMEKKEGDSSISTAISQPVPSFKKKKNPPVIPE